MLSLLARAALQTSDLAALRWKSRPVVVLGKGTLAARQRRILHDPGLRERDVVVLAGTPALGTGDEFRFAAR